VGPNRDEVLLTLKSLARLSPSVAVPALLSKMIKLIDIDSIKSLTSTELEIFHTPEGQLYDNSFFSFFFFYFLSFLSFNLSFLKNLVLESKKEEFKPRKKDSHKHLTDEQWDELVRKELAAKKAAVLFFLLLLFFFFLRKRIKIKIKIKIKGGRQENDKRTRKII